MTIIYLYRSLAAFGGVERIFIDKANYLAEHYGYHVYIITWEQGGHSIVYPLSPKVTHVDWGILFYRQYQYGLFKRMFMQWKMEKEFFKKLSNFVHTTQADIVIGASCEFTTMAGMDLLQRKTHTILETHSMRTSIEKNNPPAGNLLMRWAFKRRDKQLHQYIKHMSAFVTLTHNDAKDWSDITPQARIIPNMLHRYPAEISPDKKTQKRIITAGRLVEQKGYDLLLDAWSKVHQKHPEWILDIYGEGEDKTMLLEKRKNLALENSVLFHPPTLDIYQKYMDSDFYVMSSRFEGFGLVLAEAMSCGIPCVSFDCPHGPSDIIKDYEEGLLVEKENIKELADKICYLIENENVRIKMGHKARENVKRFLPENVMPQWKNLFESLTYSSK